MKLKNLSIEHLWVFAVLGCCFTYTATYPVELFDFWHYLKAGEWMVEHRQLLDRELFSFTGHGAGFVNLHWGSQVLFYLLYRLGGISLLEFVHACLMTVGFSILFLIARGRTGDLRIAALVTLIALLGSITNLTLRPQAYSIFFFCCTLFLLRRRFYWPIPLLMIVWANTHGAFVLGILLVAIAFVGHVVQASSGSGWRPRLDREGTVLLSILALSSLATLLTPWNFDLYPAILEAESVSRGAFISEWNPPSIHAPTGILFFVSVALLTLLHERSGKRWKPLDIITVLVFGLLALRMQRAVIWWAIATVPLFAEALADRLPRRTETQVREAGSRRMNWILLILFTAVFVGSIPWLKVKNPILPPGKRPLIATETPVELTDALRGEPTARRIFNDFSWGGYFIWRLRDDQKIFFDPRVLMYPETVRRDYLLVSSGHGEWQSILDRYEVDTVAVNKADQRLLLPLIRGSDAWQPIYEDEKGMIFVRSGP